MKSQDNRKSDPSILLPLNPWGQSLMLRMSTENWIQFTILGPRGGVQGIAFVEADKLREVGRASIRFANEIEGKTNLRIVK